MMLRTTVSRIRKVCSLGFVPRVLRDDSCKGPASYASISKLHKSTKSTDDGPGPTEKVPDLSIRKTTSIDTTTGIPLTHREKCQKIIDQAFGTGATEPETMSNAQYFSNTVDIEATRREMQEAENERIKFHEQKMKIENPMIPDDRQCGLFKMSRELIKVGDDEEDNMAENTTKKAPPTDTLTPIESGPQTLAVNKELVKTFDMASAKEPQLKIDNFQKIQVGTAPLKEPNLDCAKLDHKLNISNPVISDNVGNKAELYDDDADAENPAVNPDHKRVLNVTTAKEKEEKLSQKLETIEETPLVEAQRPGIEGFNVNPKVLGDQLSPALTCKSIFRKPGNSQERDLSGPYDEVAKRCLNHPLGKIDEILVKEMDKVGLPLTSKPENKTPSTPMGDELVQMDLCTETKEHQHEEIYPKSAESEDKDEERGNMFIKSASSIRHMCQVRLPDLNEQAEEMTLLKPEDIEPVKEDGVPNPDKIKKEIKPIPWDNKPTAKLSCYRTSELNEDEGEMEQDHHIPPSKEINMNQTIQKDTEHKHGQPQFGDLRPKVQLAAPNVTPSDNNSLQSLHLSIYKQLTGRFPPELNDRNVVVKNTEAENGTPPTAEAVKPAINPTNVSSYHPVSHASGNIGAEGLFKPEHNSNYTGVRGTSHYGTINASELAERDQRLLAERDVENKNTHSRYLASSYAWGQATEPSATKLRNENELYVNESDEVECLSRTPAFQPKTMEEQAALNERRDAANRLVETVQYTKITLPGQKWDRNIENSPNQDKVIQPNLQCSNKLHSDEDSDCKLNLEPEKVTLPGQLMKEHELDPYYVLTCNETCPISPGPSMPACRNPDFVDTSETIYMKKNICESVRPKPSSDNQIVSFENFNAERPKLDVKTLMSQYEHLTSDTKSQVNDKINISESIKPKLDCTHLVTPQSKSVPADTPVRLHKTSDVEFELIPETAPEIEDLPKIMPTVVSPEHPNLQSTQQVTLTELLYRVRERNRKQYTSDLAVKVDPIQGKCNKKAPRCVPTAPRSPPSNPVPPPSFGLPMVKRRPEICVPKKKGGGCSKKCAACDIDVTCGVQLGEICPEIACELDEAEACTAIARVDLTEVVLDHIQTLGKIVGGVLRQVKSNVETLLAREFDPWVPIPSWPIPKKERNPCDKPCDWTPGVSGAPPCVRGCPVFPKARASMNPAPPCNLKPCEGFPKRRSFSALDCFAVFIGKNKVYDLGQF